MAEERTISAATQAALDVLANASNPMSLKEMSEAAGIEIKPGNISSLVKKGLIVSEAREDVCPTCGSKHSYKVYSLVR